MGSGERAAFTCRRLTSYLGARTRAVRGEHRESRCGWPYGETFEDEQIAAAHLALYATYFGRLRALGADGVTDGEAAPDLVQQARDLGDVPSEQCSSASDSVRGVRAAVRDGVAPVAVPSGGIPRADLESAGARAVYKDPAGLLGHLDISVFADME